MNYWSNLNGTFFDQDLSSNCGEDKMSKVFIIDKQGKTSAMTRIRCANEEKELQDLLENNFDLLAGDQINPEEPRSWLLIKKEMPVPDPVSGTGGRWSIDFFFVDHTGRPTFVECKRYQDTRSRREVVGQMMEYAANAQYYWDKDAIKDIAEKTAGGGDGTLEELLTSLQGESFDSVDDFFENVENSLKQGQIRLIFFLEEAPNELKSIVEFLNNQMERSEVLIVEAKQYATDGLKVVVPSLFGYSEQARRIKKTVTVSPTVRVKWTRDKFIKKIGDANIPLRLSRTKDLFELADNHPDLITLDYGTGQISGSVMFKNSNGKTMLVLWDSGSLKLYAIGSIRDRFEFFVELTEKYDQWLKWKAEFEVGRAPTLTKKIEELSEEEFEKFKEFILELAESIKEVA